MATTARQKPMLISIKVSDIAPSKSNPRDDNDPGFSKESLTELSKSIKEQGLIQPIVVRKNGSSGKYELVCGERRYRACKMADLIEIPATVRELTDSEAFDLQITENLQRKDVHPLDEAIAFKTIMERKGETTQEIALRFGKSESFVALRLKLNELIPEFKKLFYSGKMLIGHALLLCRLTEEEQKRMNEDNDILDITVDDLGNYIEREVMHNLNSVAFKKDDHNLLPKAGPCTTCPKRSGCNPSLFPDIKEKDRCFDADCFNAKNTAYIKNEIQDILTNHPEVVFLKNYANPNKEIEQPILDMKVKILKEYSDFQGCHKKDKGAIRGFWVSGTDKGKYEYVRLNKTKGSIEVSERSVSNPAEVQIESIKQRAQRAKELDAEKIHARILNDFEGIAVKHNHALNESEQVALWWMMIEKGNGYSGEICNALKIDQEHFSSAKHFDEIYKRIIKLTPSEKSLIVRKSFFRNYRNNYPSTMYTAILADMAKNSGVPVEKYHIEQKEICDKREARAKERINDLKSELVEKKTKKKKQHA